MSNTEETPLASEQARLLITTEETAVGDTVDTVGVQPGLARGTLGPAHIVFMVMAAVAPAGGAVAILPLAIALGVGVGTPGMFVVVGAVLTLFAVGFTRMVPYVRNAGAFFAYIANGLGRPPGLAAAYVALSAYLSIGCATAGAMGFFASTTVEQFFGVHIAWWVFTIIGLAVCFVLGYFRITLAAGVLATALILEGTVVLVLDVAILFQAGFSAFPLESFSPSQIFVPGVIGVGVIFAFSCFQGFEGTAIYAEEARDPETTVPRATYAAIASVCLFFVLTSWAMIAGAGGSAAPAKALADPGNFAYSLSDQYVGSLWTDILEILIVTSCFAGVLAFHNAASRYFFALARDRFMPSRLAAVHPRFASPINAGIASSALMLVVVVAFAIAGLDPLTTLTSALTGFGAVGLLGLVTLTSAAVVVFFWRRRQFGWVHTVAPVLATLGLGTATIMALVNYDAITGTSSKVINSLPWLHVVTVVTAIGVAMHAKSRRRSDYDRMGRTLVD
ncbi:APC family permease [Nocardioides sp. AN3]